MVKKISDSSIKDPGPLVYQAPSIIANKQKCEPPHTCTKPN